MHFRLQYIIDTAVAGTHNRLAGRECFEVHRRKRFIPSNQCKNVRPDHFLQYSLDGKQLAVGRGSNVVRLDAATGRQIGDLAAKLMHPQNFALDRAWTKFTQSGGDGSALRIMLSAARPGTVDQLRAARDELVGALAAHALDVTGVGFRHDPA